MSLREHSQSPAQLGPAGTGPRQPQPQPQNQPQHQHRPQNQPQPQNHHHPYQPQPQHQHQHQPQTQHHPYQPQPQHQQQYRNPLNAVRKTMSTMETLGIRLPPPGFRGQDAPQPTTTTTYQQPWRHDVPNVHITPPNAINQQTSQSFEQTYDSLSSSFAQFQPDPDHLEECGLSYTPSLSGRMYSFHHLVIPSTEWTKVTMIC